MNPWHWRYKTWEGTAEKLAEELPGLLPRFGLPETDGAPNVRLIRHYVTVGALTRPTRRGKEAIFTGRNLLEALVIRSFLAQGWPLQKIADVIRAADWDTLAGLLPKPANRAQELVAKFAAQAQAPSSRPTSSLPAATVTTLFRSPTTDHLALESDLAALGNLSGTADRREVIRLTVAPWCTVEVDRAALPSLTPDQAAHAGDALRRLLIQEFRKQGGRS
jgi:DNA-binding transcriptional MerR regulator